MSEREADVLRGLHGRGLGVPCVFLFTGLSHTGDRIHGLDGLSRLARDATINNMGRMADAECEASTAMMLEELGVETAEAASRKAVGVVVEESYGWPQHLSCAQQAVCRELVRTNGDPKGVDLDRLRAESTVARHAYYAGRTSYGELARWPALVAAVASQVMANRANTEPELTKLCRGEIRRLTLHADQDFTAEPLDFVRQMIEKGVLSFASDGRYNRANPVHADLVAGHTRAIGEPAGYRGALTRPRPQWPFVRARNADANSKRFRDVRVPPKSGRPQDNPSTGIAAPWIASAAGEARKSTTSAIACGDTQ